MRNEDDLPASSKQSGGQENQQGSQLWGWFWVVVATLGLYLVVWLSR
jgi:hypothetical protein